MQWKMLCLFELEGKSMKTETTASSQFPNGRNATVEQIPGSEEINKTKRAGLGEFHSEIQVGKLTTWIRSFEVEKL